MVCQCPVARGVLLASRLPHCLVLDLAHFQISCHAQPKMIHQIHLALVVSCSFLRHIVVEVFDFTSSRACRAYVRVFEGSL